VVRVRAAALNPKDVLTRSGKFRLFAGRRFPKRVGYDWAGEIAEVGPGVSGLAVGDPVFGMIQAWTAGACGELVEVRPDELARKPAHLDWEHAAALPLASLTALQALRDLGELAAGQRVLIHGASGGVGVHAVQIARALGAHVTTLTSAAAMDSGALARADDRSCDLAAARRRKLAGRRVRRGVRRVRQPHLDGDAAAAGAACTFISTVPKPARRMSRFRTAFAPPARAADRGALASRRSRLAGRAMRARLTSGGGRSRCRSRRSPRRSATWRRGARGARWSSASCRRPGLLRGDLAAAPSISARHSRRLSALRRSWVCCCIEIIRPTI
jgi:hypothetical protein